MFSNEVNENLYQDILGKCGSYSKVGIIGVSFKPNSPVTVGSPSVRLIEDLLKQGREVYTYDDIEETYNNLNGLGDSITKCHKAQECVDKSEIVVIMHPEKQYASLNIQKSLVDFWGVFSSDD